MDEAIVASHIAITDIVRYLDSYNLSVLPAGTPQPAPYELLNSSRLQQLLAELRQSYDYVLIDTPPFVPFPDGRLLSRWTDRFLVVIAANKTPRQLLAEALKLLLPPNP